MSDSCKVVNIIVLCVSHRVSHRVSTVVFVVIKIVLCVSLLVSTVVFVVIECEQVKHTARLFWVLIISFIDVC